MNGGAWLCRAMLRDAMRAVSLVYLCCLCAAGIGGGSLGPDGISGAGGFARRLFCGCGRCALVASIPGVWKWSHAFAYGVGHRSAPRGMFTGSPAEVMQIRPEQEVVPLAEGDAQSPQRTLDPRPLSA